MPGISYLYDGEGRRVLKTVGSVTTEYVYGAAGELVTEYGGNAPVVKSDVLPDRGPSGDYADGDERKRHG